MKKNMTLAEQALTPLAEMLMENGELFAKVEQLAALIFTVMPDIGDELDAVRALRDTAAYIAAKQVDERLTNQSNDVNQLRKLLEEQKAAEGKGK